jgi:multidrug efflux pump subunit AcrA (membrane-fusion protein)
VVVAAGGSVALATTSSDGSSPVTARIGTGNVTQTVTGSGTVAASSKTSVSFPTNGTVAKVSVKTGQAVTKGQVLAQLDTTSLQSSVDSANATLATAEQKLQADESGQTSTSGSGSSSGTGGATSLTADTDTTDALSTESTDATPVSTTSVTPAAKTTTGTAKTPSTGSASSSTLTKLVAQIQAAQKQLIAAQQAVDKDQTDVDDAQKTVDADIVKNAQLRDVEKTACDADVTAGTPESAACTSARADYETFADTLSADMTILDKAITAQDAAIKTLDTSISSLDKLLGQLSSAAAGSGSGTGGSGSGTGSGSGGTGSGSTGSGSGGTGSGGTGSGGTGSGSGTGSSGSGSSGRTGSSGGSGSSSTGSGTAGSGSGSSGSASTTTASASQLAADQAAIDAAEAQITLAEQNLAAATLKSPLTGTIASVGLTAGSGSSGKTVTILGTGNQVVSIAVTLSQIDQVKKGQAVAIAVDGRTDVLKGTVSNIGLLSTTSGSLTTFPVTITLASGSPAIHDGVGADVTITTGSATGVLLVPNSAITTVGTRHAVTVVKGGKTQTVSVTLGLVGTDSSQVKSGLTAGEEVQLADPKQDLPSSTTSSSTTNRFGGGTFTGGGNFGTFRVGGN